MGVTVFPPLQVKPLVKNIFSLVKSLLLLHFVSIHCPASYFASAQLILPQAYLDYHDGGS